MVGHVLLFHPAFQKMKQIIDHGELGKIQYIYSNRLNLELLERMKMYFGVLLLMILLYLITFLKKIQSQLLRGE